MYGASTFLPVQLHAKDRAGSGELTCSGMKQESMADPRVQIGSRGESGFGQRMAGGFNVHLMDQYVQVAELTQGGVPIEYGCQHRTLVGKCGHSMFLQNRQDFWQIRREKRRADQVVPNESGKFMVCLLWHAIECLAIEILIH